MASPGFRSLCAFTQPDHSHQECRPALFSDFPAPSVPPPADGGWTWSFPLAPFPLSMSSRYLWRRQKITLSLSDMRKPFMREICPGCFISLWPGGHLRRLSFGRLLCTCGQQWGAVMPTALLRDGVSGQVDACRERAEVVPGKAALEARILKFSFQYKKPKWKKEGKKSESQSTM